MRALTALTASLMALFASPVAALDCRETTYEDVAYALCEVETATERLELFLNDPTGRPYGHFSAISKLLFIWLMMLGRIEIFSILVLFLPGFWKDH